MAIPYRTAKFKSTNSLAIAILGSIAKFNARQYFRLYGSNCYIIALIHTDYNVIIKLHWSLIGYSLMIYSINIIERRVIDIALYKTTGIVHLTPLH